MTISNKKLTAYLLWAFGLGWAFQILGAYFYRQENLLFYQVALIVTMLMPILAVVLSGAGIKTLGWKPNIRRDIRYILLAWLAPAVLGALGAALYYVTFPAAFDTGFGYVVSQLGADGVAQMEKQGMTLQYYAVVSAVSSLTYGPFVNMFPAVGEEAGWRGVMTPALKERLGAVKGRLLAGVLWGAWHWPIMLLAGYEYGTEYWGAPVTGMVLFCVITTAMGILLDWLYEKTNCIWLPALGHGAINAFAGVPVTFLAEGWTNRLLLGPLMIGLIGGLPMIAAAVIILVRQGEGKLGEKL